MTSNVLINNICPVRCFRELQAALKETQDKYKEDVRQLKKKVEEGEERLKCKLILHVIVNMYCSLTEAESDITLAL